MTYQEANEWVKQLRSARDKRDEETCNKIAGILEESGWTFVFSAEPDNWERENVKPASMPSVGWRLHVYLEKEGSRIWVFKHGWGSKGDALKLEEEMTKEYKAFGGKHGM